MRIAIVSDAWFPQVNGVVRTLHTLTERLAARGHETAVIHPGLFRSLPCPSYPEIRLAVLPGRRVARLLLAHQPCAIHIATEGPLGMAARRFCIRKGLPFTTAYHTRFPEYVHARWRIPLGISYAFLRRFHEKSSAIMVATESIEQALVARGFRNIRRWTRGVDTEQFRPGDKGFLDHPRPIALYVGRIAVEKNVEAFLSLPFRGTKLVVGDGPQRADLQRRFADARFVGAKHGEELARYYAAADVFVFPSRTDTFGLVLLEAMAAGLPVAAYPVPGPLDVIGRAGPGALDDDLGVAIERALAVDPARCRDYALRFSWDVSAGQFLDNLRPFPPMTGAAGEANVIALPDGGRLRPDNP